MTVSNICILGTIAVYLVGMLIIGFRCARKNESSADFYLGGRKLGPLVTAMSAEASDMSSYLLMGLPGLAYLSGVADVGWTAIGLAVGTYLNWLFTALRLRRYTQETGSFTIPQFFSRRFRDDKNILRLMSSRKLAGKRDRINIYNTNAVDSACLYGVVHPAVYVNNNVGDNEFIISHELTHYRHRDNWWALVRMLCVCIYWFNPLVWVAAHFHKEDCELFCDEAVIRNCSASERQKYGEMLLNAAARHSGRLSDIYLLSGASSGYRELKKRIERIAGSRKTYKSAAFVLIMIVVAVTVLAFGGGSVKGSRKLSESGIEADIQKDNDKMQNYLVTEYRYDLTHDGVDDVVSMEVYGYAADISNVDEALKDTRKYVTVTVKDGITGQILYKKEVGNSHSQNGFVSIVSANGNYYIMDGIKGVWQGDGLERFTVYDFSSGTKNVVDECKVDYYASEESAERSANHGQSLVSQQEADEIYNGRIARWNDGVVVLIECMIY